jgi:uncharacterized protein (DUF2147 family)
MKLHSPSRHRARGYPQLFRSVVLVFLVAILATPLRAQAGPIGFWRTVSDVDGKPTAVIEISKSGGYLVGTVRELLVSVDSADRFCRQCTGSRKGQPILGMQILWGMRPDGDEWNGGAILDPDNGRIYKANMRLIDDGKKLIVRGFIGFSFLGRSQTWTRVE